VRLSVVLDIPDGWAMWSLDPGEGPTPLTIRLEPSRPLRFEGRWRGPPPERAYYAGFGWWLEHYRGRGRLERLAEVSPHAELGPVAAPLEIHGQLCSEGRCVYQDAIVEVALHVTAEPAALGAPAPRSALDPPVVQDISARSR
jgi:hypothetical protein